MNIFCDFHHSDLYYSLHCIFEKRLGFKLYRPIGLDWFDAGYWQIAKPYNHAIDTVKQYLDIAPGEWDQYKNLNGNHFLKDGEYNIFEPVHKYYHHAITFEKFKTMKFDAIISSVDIHDRCYEDLRNKHQPQAKIIAHLGNVGQRTHLPNAIHSVPYTPSANQNAVYLNQELDQDVYTYIPQSPGKNIYSVVNCLPYANIYHKYKSLLPEINMKAYGASTPDGSLFGCRGVAEKMREANIGWHCKPQGGLGHSAMGWMLSGRPIITNMSQNRNFGGLALKLFEPGVTVHDIEKYSEAQNCEIIRSMLDPEVNIQWGERARARFLDLINYDEEEKSFRNFWANLK